jgi:CDP-diacylglycerol--serine O-phosphatidyltransferase
MKQIPNIFTLANLFLGCLAIIFITQPGLVPVYSEADGQLVPNVSPDGSQYITVPEQIYIGSILIGIAAVVDFLDGFVAKLLKQTSEMGKQLDSLSDIVSFGVAPAMILYEFLRMSLAKDEGGLDQNIIWLLPAFLVPCCGAYRLARFTVSANQSSSFRGVPIPAVGLFIASIPLIYWFADKQWIIDLILNKWFLYAVIVLVCYLMVSTLPMMSLKIKDFSFKNNGPLYILVMLGILAVIFLHWLAIPVIFIFYVLLSLVFKNKIA